MARQIQHIESKCIHCFACSVSCPEGAISVRDMKIHIDRKNCSDCGICERNCPSGAISVVGKEITAGEAFAEMEEDRIFYETSGGGITISGGEPFMQAGFVIELLKLCKENGLHTAVETNLSFPWQTIAKALPYADLWMCDLKCHDSGNHRLWTGSGNEIIKENISRLLESGANVLVRTPVIPGVNDNPEEIRKICTFLKGLGGNPGYELLPFHNLGFGKFCNLGMENLMDRSASLDTVRFESLKAILKEYDF